MALQALEKNQQADLERAQDGATATTCYAGSNALD
jgi:hypothetical protein